MAEGAKQESALVEISCVLYVIIVKRERIQALFELFSIPTSLFNACKESYNLHMQSSVK